MSTAVHAAATPLSTYRAGHACRVRRDERVALCCPTSETQHVTTLSCAKMHGLDNVSCHDATSRILVISCKIQQRQKVSTELEAVLVQTRTTVNVQAQTTIGTYKRCSDVADKPPCWRYSLCEQRPS